MYRFGAVLPVHSLFLIIELFFYLVLSAHIIVKTSLHWRSTVHSSHLKLNASRIKLEQLLALSHIKADLINSGYKPWHRMEQHKHIQVNKNKLLLTNVYSQDKIGSVYYVVEQDRLYRSFYNYKSEVSANVGEFRLELTSRQLLVVIVSKQHNIVSSLSYEPKA